MMRSFEYMRHFLFATIGFVVINASAVGEPLSLTGTIYTSRDEWLAASRATMTRSENFESFSNGWNNSPAIRSWGRVESEEPNPYAIWIEGGAPWPSKSLQIGAPVNMLRPNQQSDPLVAFGFDYIGYPELKLFDRSYQHFETIEPELTIAVHPFKFFGWLAAPGQTFSEFTVTSLSGHSLIDNLTFAFRPVPEPNTLLLLGSAALTWTITRWRKNGSNGTQPDPNGSE